MPVDAVFRDHSGRDFNEFVPVDLLLGPYMRDLQTNAAARDHVVKSEGVCAVLDVNASVWSATERKI